MFNDTIIWLFKKSTVASIGYSLYLLNGGIDINAVNNNGESAAQIAYKSGFYDITAILIGKGAYTAAIKNFESIETDISYEYFTKYEDLLVAEKAIALFDSFPYSITSKEGSENCMSFVGISATELLEQG